MAKDENLKKQAQELFAKAYEAQTAGRIEEAISGYRKSIEMLPTAEAYTFLGWAYSFKHRYDDAIQLCKKAIELDPDFGNPYNDIGAYLIEKGKLDEAIPWFEKAIQAKRYDSYCYPHYNLGRVYERKGNWHQALQCYQRSLETNSDYVLAEKSLNRLKALLN